ncbi:hypothetical protein VQ03_00230 [Methylobacterium tarhaniae]|uniref:Chloramphenicol phosphotransferase n=1 Tax=Methylobacterium tarhaniae TaxID=1187852 RepID=A0A0J6TGB1_9HYPH|nr:AAA family ATPase [Methylobacterium tarhaniae]KMO44989.1 hypothetical protein VQ03_00230 [Methylobacterium tarhaniae]
MAGRIIVIMGTSSAGKTTLIKALREDMPEPFCLYSADQLTDGNFAAVSQVRDRSAPEELAAFHRGFSRSVVAFADAGNDLIVELVIETQEQAQDLKEALAGHDVFWVWVSAPKPELERREKERGDRRTGAALHYLSHKAFLTYDLEVDTTELMEDNVFKIADAWRNRRSPA